MPYIIKVNPKTGEMKNDGLGCEDLPNQMDVIGSMDSFTFKLPIGYSVHQIYWNKRELQFEEYYVLLKKESRGISSPEVEVYTGGRSHIKKRDVKEFYERKDVMGVSYAPKSIVQKLIYVGDRGEEFMLETEQIGRYRQEYPDKSTLIYGKQKIPLEEMLVRGKSSL